MSLTKRVPLHSSKFRMQHRAAKAFHAPQRPRAEAEAVASTYVAPKPVKRSYRGSDNPRAHRQPLTARRMDLSERMAVRGGAESRRRVTRVWVAS